MPRSTSPAVRPPPFTEVGNARIEGAEEGATESAFAKMHVATPEDVALAAELKHTMATVVAELNQTFHTGVTKDLAWRKQQLRQLITLVKENIEQIIDAISKDLGGPNMRGCFELGSVEQAAFALKNLDRWARDERLPWGSPWAKSVVRREPKGVVLLISPWNFPIELVLNPLVGILAAGNCCVIKPSEVSSASCALLCELVPKYLSRDAVRVVSGGVAETTALLAQRWDHIMYTGNGSVGRIVMATAAKHLTPVTLELGGKSPVIVDSSAKLGLAAKRIVQAKFGANAGQVCISPDFVLVHKSVEAPLLDALAAEVRELLGSTREAQGVGLAKGAADAQLCAYGKIVNAQHVGRIAALLDGCGGTVTLGDVGAIDPAACYVPPLIVSRPSPDSDLLRQEIFGPVLPVIPVASLDEAIARSRHICAHPLALYVFSEERAQAERVLRALTSGGAAVNTAMEHLSSLQAPFGGVGGSGMGQYHGRFGFEEFSHKRHVLYRTTLLPLTLLPPGIKEGIVPDWVAGLVIKLAVTGFVPEWLKQVAKLVCAAGAALAAALVAQRLGL